MPKTILGDAPKVYCAGPLFNRSERNEMSAIAEALSQAGYSVFLPHRDGMEFRLIHEVLVDRGWIDREAAKFLHAAIFALDVFQLALECDAFVWNLNGRTPDEGAVSEAAIAWTLGKPIVAYKDDVRSLIAGQVNPLLVGLVDFRTVEEISEIPDALSTAIVSHDWPPIDVNQMSPKIQQAAREGEALWQTMTGPGIPLNDERIADVVTELFAPESRVQS